MRHLLGILLFISVVFGQVNDKNFKEKVNGGMVVVIVSAEWQEREFDEDILKGVKGYQDCEIVRMKSEDAPKVVKKLRFRNSIKHRQFSKPLKIQVKIRKNNS